MDDHVHILLRPADGVSAKELAQRWKSISSRRITKEGFRRAPLWQAEYFDRWMGGSDQTGVCARYILDNPRRRWHQLDDYRWVVDNWSAP